MPYLNIDDGMDEHPKVEALSDAAFRMHFSAMLYCARRGTDGAIPRAKARRISDTASDAVAAELVKAGVWHDLGEGCTDSRTCLVGIAAHYVIHDFLQWNHSADWWEQRSEDQDAKGSKAMHRRWHVRRSVFREDCKHCQADNTSNNTGYSHSNNKPITEPEPEPEPEPISVSKGPALTNHPTALPTDRARERSLKAIGDPA
jgi:hypothetical protein